MTLLARIADRVLNRPLLITPEKAQVIMSVLSGRIGVNAPEASEFFGKGFERDRFGRLVGEPYRHQDGVAVITIVGSLVNRGAWIGADSGLVSYEGIKFQIQKAVANDDIHTIILDEESPGGEAVGTFEVAEAVREARKSKRVVAIANGMAASAAYAIASGAHEIVVTPTALTGSIGVVLLHADYSRALDEEGITPSLIFAGAHKVDGNPFEPLSKDVRSSLQAEVNTFYDLFVDTVLAGRGDRIDAKGIKATEARTFIGAEAVEVGLADTVGTFEDVIKKYSRAPVGRSNSQTRGTSMSEQPGAPAAETPAGISEADHKAAIDKAVADARTAERERISAIMGSKEAKGREQQANHIAFKTDMDPAEAETMLATGSKAEAEKPDDADEYAKSRADAAGQAQPSPKPAPAHSDLNANDIYKRRQSAA